MELKKEPRIALEFSLRKAVVITTTFAIIITTGIFIYSNLAPSSDTMASTQNSAGFTCYGPGGIGNSTSNRFYYDLDSLNYSHDDKVSSIANTGGNGTPWEQSTSANQPLFKTGDSGMNGHPVLAFDGTNDYLKLTDQTDLNRSKSNARTYVVVIRTRTDITTRQVIYEEGGATRGLNVYIYDGKLYLGGWNRANDGDDSPWYFTSVDSTISTNTEYIITMVYDGSTDNTTSGKIWGFLNGGYMGVATGIGTLYAHGDDIGLGGMNNNSYFENGAGNGTGHYFKGDLATFIEYNYAMDTSDRCILESSLSAKFDIDILNDLFSYDANGYHHNVAGIGNCGTSQNTCASSGDLIQISNPSDLDSGEYLLFGHNLETGSSASDNPSGVYSRWRRKIMFDEMGDVGTVDVTFSLSQTEFTIGDASDLRLMVDSDGDGDMSNAQLISGTYDGSKNTVTYTGVQVGNEVSYTMGTVSSANALPVDFVFFQAEKLEDQVELSWATATETNNSHFEIQRSLDGNSFEVIGEEKGNGNSNSVINYVYLANKVPVQSKPVYYRLRQVDFDGQSEFSPVSYVLGESEKHATVYPNPADDIATVSKEGFTFDIVILDRGGNMVFSQTGVSDQIRMPVSELPNGFYIVQISSASGDESHKLLVRH